ncbi:hypothetical protein ACQUSY_07645 [Microbacterium sp. YY-03]|uniref:hypothetical protein n=1 Tax=Microbacterium sp. YY-03 TaxID=3421636 RepID=UPI003D16B072
MSPRAGNSGRIGLLVAIGVIALLIASGAVVLAMNPPFQGEGKPEPNTSASATSTATPSPSATPTAMATPSATLEPTPTATPTGDPVPDDTDFRAAVSPYLTDAATGLDIISESVAGGSFDGTQDVITQLQHDVQRLFDNAKPSDPETWNGAVQTYAGAIDNLSQALGNSDLDRTTTALDSARRDLESLVSLAS